jgi:hypothetical protein
MKASSFFGLLFAANARQLFWKTLLQIPVATFKSPEFREPPAAPSARDRRGRVQDFLVKGSSLPGNGRRAGISMSFIMQCPYCPTKIKLPGSAKTATCPKCLKSFAAVHEDEHAAPEETAIREEKGLPAARASTGIKKPVAKTAPAKRRPTAPVDDDDEESAFPAWISPWGVVGFSLATFGLLAASIVGIRMVTTALAALGLIAILVGLITTRKNRQFKDVVWLGLGGILSISVLVLVFVAPGIIYGPWAMDVALAKIDMDSQVRIPRDLPRDSGKPLGPDEWVDAVNEAIRQGEIFMRVESVKLDTLADKGATQYLLIHLRLANVGITPAINFEGFSNEKHKPALTDATGKSYKFIEPRRRKEGVKGIMFKGPGPNAGVMASAGRLDSLLVFEAPAGGVESFKLTIPTAAWGAKGVGKFSIPGYFDAPLPRIGG